MRAPSAPGPAADVAPPVSYRHLLRLGDGIGVFEHAAFDEPRREHGYCLDDVARTLLVLTTEPEPDAPLVRLREVALRFVDAAIQPDGRAHNRRDERGRWADEGGLGDWWGRAVHALGVAQVTSPGASARLRARRAFERAAARRSPYLRASAAAAIGAAAVLRSGVPSPTARALVEDFAGRLQPRGGAWPWPEPRLTYANGTLPEAALLSGSVLGEPALVGYGLDLLRFLLETETEGGHLSVTGQHGRLPGQRGPLFDQQPLEVAALAAACATATAVTGEPRWWRGVDLGWAWFLGRNDAAVPMGDLRSGAGYDGLEPTGRNENRGAESTLAFLAVWQLARRRASDGVAA